jgi:DNA-directed RNA polymerase
LGCKIIDILDNSDMLKKVLIKSSRSVIKNHYILQRVDQRLLPIKDKHTIMSLPTKLPMVVKPKPFSDKQYGGYILNDVNYS